MKKLNSLFTCISDNEAAFWLSIITSAMIVSLAITFTTPIVHESRIICTDFKTPWSFYSGINNGVVEWRVLEKWEPSIVYKIPEGHVCNMERRSYEKTTNK